MFDEKVLRSTTNLQVQATMLLVDEIRDLKNLLGKVSTPNLIDYSNMVRGDLMANMKINNPPEGWTKYSNQQMKDYLTKEVSHG